jgi:hypothetical protein
MWVFTEDGFFSAVQLDDEEDIIQVRSRAEDNLGALIGRLQTLGYSRDDIICTPDRDYPWRVMMKREDWAKYLSDYATDDLVYSDFKSRIRLGTVHSDPSRLHALARVWGVMYDQYARRPTNDVVEFRKSSDIWNRIGRDGREG